MSWVLLNFDVTFTQESIVLDSWFGRTWNLACQSCLYSVHNFDLCYLPLATIFEPMESTMGTIDDVKV